MLTLVGLPAAGKSTVSEILRDKYGFNWIKTRDIVRLLAADAPVTNLQDMGSRLSSGDGAQAFCRELFGRIDPIRPNVVDAVRPKEHWDRISAEYGPRACLVSIVAPRRIREMRIESSRPNESVEARDKHEVETDVPALVEECVFTIVNLDHLDFRVQQMIEFLSQAF